MLEITEDTLYLTDVQSSVDSAKCFFLLLQSSMFYVLQEHQRQICWLFIYIMNSETANKCNPKLSQPLQYVFCLVLKYCLNRAENCFLVISGRYTWNGSNSWILKLLLWNTWNESMHFNLSSVVLIQTMIGEGKKKPQKRWVPVCFYQRWPF